MKLKKITALILLSAILLCGCGADKTGRDTLSIWCLEGEPLAMKLGPLIDDYNSQLKKGLLPASLRLFSSEEELAAGFNTTRPDILICSMQKGEELFSQGISRDMSFALMGLELNYPEYLKNRLPIAGSGYFPVGGDSLLLLSATEAPADFAALMEEGQKYAHESSLPYFGADCYSELFYALMLSSGKEFHGERLIDMKSEVYTGIYNLIAEAAFDGGIMLTDGRAAESVKAGYIKCAAVRGSEIARVGYEGLRVSCLPASGSDSSLPADCSGISVTVRQGRSTDSAAAFLRWLSCEGKAERLALSCGLIPLSLSQSSSPNGDLEQLLFEIGREKELHFPEISCDYFKNRREFETEFQNALKLLK